jgi:hypothetical protein
MADNLDIDGDFLVDLEYDEVEGPRTSPRLSGVSQLSGAAAAAKMKRKDKYRLPYINALDVAGWVAILLVIWLVYTLFTGAYSYVNSVGTPATSVNIAEMTLEREKIKRVKARKKRLVAEQRIRQENDEAFLAISERIESFDPNAAVVEPEEVEESEEPKKPKKSFSLGRAISKLLLKDLSKGK